MPEFHETRMGQKFYEHTVPELVRELALLNKLLTQAVVTYYHLGSMECPECGERLRVECSSCQFIKEIPS